MPGDLDCHLRAAYADCPGLGVATGFYRSSKWHRRSQDPHATDGLRPDVVVLLDIPVEIGLRRRHADPASVNRIDLAGTSFHQRVREAYLALAAASPATWLVVDATPDPAAVEAWIWNQLPRHLASG